MTVASPYRLAFTRPRTIFDLRDALADARTRGRAGRPFGPVRLRVVARLSDGDRHELPAPLDLVAPQNPGGYVVWFGDARTSDGERRALAAGRYAIAIASANYQPAEVEVDVPELEDAPFTAAPPPLVVALEPAATYPFERGGHEVTRLLGSVHAEDGRGVEDAVVSAAGALSDCRTDATGQWLLAFPDDQPSGPVNVVLQLPDEDPVTVPARLERRQATTLLQTSLRGVVRVGDRYGGAIAVITVSDQNRTSRSRPDGRWALFLAPGFEPDPGDPTVDETTVDVTATLPDGRSLVHDDVVVRRNSSALVPTFDFTGP